MLDPIQAKRFLENFGQNGYASPKGKTKKNTSLRPH